MKKLMMFVLVAFCATLVAQPLSAAMKDNLKGSWDYKAPYAPYEYSKGKLIFAEDNGVATVAVRFMSGTVVKAQNVKIEKEDISFGVTVEGYYVKFTGKLADGKITGKADAPNGLIDLTAEKGQ